MKKHLIIIVVCSLLGHACKDQLDIENPNVPQFSILETEQGLLNYSMGAVYVHINKYSTQSSYSYLTQLIHEAMGDVVGTAAANFGLNQIACPDVVILDDGSQLPNPQSPAQQKAFIRQINLNENQGANPLYYEWAVMYIINNGCNLTLSYLERAAFIGNASTVETKKKVIESWCYFWKGFAYSRIGSMYWAGIINNEPNNTNGNYVTREVVLAEAESNFAKAEAILNTLDAGGVYDETLGKLIPNINQVGKGGIPTPDMWKRNINTLRARNILVNTTAANMGSAEWMAILNLTTNGIQASDKIFTMRSNATADIMSPTGGNVPAAAALPVAGGSQFNIVSERLIQDFKPGDRRLPNNFLQTAPFIGDLNRGIIFNSRWTLRNNGAGMPGVIVMASRTAGVYEYYMTSFHEENELMKAEANIYLGNLDAGLGLIDYIRTMQGANLAAVSGTGLTLPAALEELRRERRVGLAFRGLSFYDARRWDVINNGRTGAVLLDFEGVLNTNATIQYNYLDYWDVPDNELVFNPPLQGIELVKNPNGL